MVVLLPATSHFGAAQNAVALADRQEAEERYRRMNARIEALEEALQSYQQRINTLNDEVRGLRAEIARLGARNEGAASQGAIEQLAEKIREVDRKREKDNKEVLEELAKFGRNLKTGSPPPRPTPTPSTGPEKGYEYTIREGDTLSGIVASLREQGFNVTQKQVENANPNAKWTRLQIGQKIFIPAP